MKNAIEFKNVTKNYTDFALDDVSFTVPKGYITGLIGENGAGKTTLLKMMMQLTGMNRGEIIINNQPLVRRDKKILDDIYIIFDEAYLNEAITPKDYQPIYSHIYSKWNQMKYFELLNQFNLPLEKKIADFSKGMKVKLNFALAFASNPSILLLDEATSGLDPFIREEILDLLLDYIQDETKTVLLSTHIISDLDKIADKIIFIQNGQVKFEQMKDNIDENYGLALLSDDELKNFELDALTYYRKSTFGHRVLISNKAQFKILYPEKLVEQPTLEDIIQIIGKGDIL